MSERDQEITGFLGEAGWAGASRAALAGDASRRRYERIHHAEKGRAILMDAPPDTGETTLPFIAITGVLRDQGLSAPEVLAADTERGLLLLEDLGDRLYAIEARDHPEIEAPIYEAAVDVLLALHRGTPPADLAVYDAPTMAPLGCLSLEWYAGRNDAGAFETLLAEELSSLGALGEVLILRDYHAENLLWLPERQGEARVGLLDYQDALRGHAAYDLASLLGDARRDVPMELRDHLVRYYTDRAGIDAGEFSQALHLLGVQRNLRILGVFARLGIAYGKPRYLDLIPRVWGNLIVDLERQGSRRLRVATRSLLPEPGPEHLDKLRAKCRG